MATIPLRTTQDSADMADARTVDALDVWVRFENDADETPDAEANVFPHGDIFQVQWYLDAVGLVTAVDFATHDDARAWLTQQGFADFTA